MARQRFQVNLAGIIDLLSAHLYSGPEVYLRELLQNGVDALTARAALAGRGDPGWGVHARAHIVDGRATLVFHDDGVGLLPDELERFLSTIGESSKRGDLQAGLEAARGELLGQFGIGLLSCFMVSDEIVVVSRSARRADAPVVEWRGRGDGTYDSRVLDGADIAHGIGTTVTLVPRRGAEEWVEAGRVRELVARFGAMLPWPVVIDDGVAETRINEQAPPWQLDARRERAALLRAGNELLGEDIFDAIPIKSEAGLVDGVAYVLARPRALAAGRGDRVYLKGMLLSESAEDLLPEWAFFVKAVVNARALRPTASRESLYTDAVLDDARDELGGQLRRWLVALMRSEPHKMGELVLTHHLAMKQLAAHDDEFLDIILDVLPFETTHGYLPFQEIRALAGRNHELRYTTSRDAFRQMAPIARSEGIILVNAAYVFEGEILERAAAHGVVTLKKVDGRDLADNLLDAGPEVRPFLALAQEALHDMRVRVDVKRFTPTQLPAFFATTDDVHLARAIDTARDLQQDGSAWGGLLDDLKQPVRDARPQLVFNAACPLVERLITLAGDVQDGGGDVDEHIDRIGTAVRVLYVQSLLLGHHPLGPKELHVLNAGLSTLLEWGLDGRES